MYPVMPAWERPGFCHHPHNSLSDAGVCGWCGTDTGRRMIGRIPLLREFNPPPPWYWQLRTTVAGLSIRLSPVAGRMIGEAVAREAIQRLIEWLSNAAATFVQVVLSPLLPVQRRVASSDTDPRAHQA